MRNVRQAVRRTHNAGVRTEILREGDLSEPDRAKLRALATDAMGGAEERGFSMNMDELLTGRHAFPVVVVARDAHGSPVGLQRYLPSASGRRLSLDAMRRAPGSPNGLNERMIVDIMAYAGEHGVDEVSLNFAAFRALLETEDRGALKEGGYHLIHLLDRFVKVESLYLFNRKFKPRYVARSVMFPSWASLVPIGAALLTLEFGHWRAGSAPARRAEPVTEDSRTTLPTYPGW
jgi:lysyl-tRNA synthetase class 2